MMRTSIGVTVSVAAALTLGGCELGPKVSSQTGYRGTGLQQTVNLNLVAKQAAIPAIVYPLPADEGPLASASYENVQVLGNVSTERFNHLMAQMNLWVVPANIPVEQQGCNYCHNPENMASDEKYTKVVARRMIQMTRNINSKWASHVQQTGVTCYTCHRGNAVPEYKWAVAERTPDMATIRGNRRGQNAPDPNVGYASLPSDPFARYFVNDTQQVRVASSSALPAPDHVVSIKDAEATYGVMMHLSSALGVNCTYCHNSQSFRAWNLSSAQRGTAYYGIRMVRDTNANYIDPLAAVFPANRKGPHGDPYKVNCTTCHQGINKPLGGISMIDQAPTLRAEPLVVSAPGTSPKAAPAVVDAFAKPAAMTGGQ